MYVVQLTLYSDIENFITFFSFFPAGWQINAGLGQKKLWEKKKKPAHANKNEV